MSEVFYVLVCRDCSDDPIPFPSAQERGRWAAMHTRGTGHERFFVLDQPALSNPTEENNDV